MKSALVILLALAGAGGTAVILTNRSAASAAHPVLATEVQHSTDGGETWSDVTSAGSATGTVAEVGDERTQYYWVQVTANDVYGIRKLDVAAQDQNTFYNAFAAAPSTNVTMSWTAAGRYAGVQ